MLALLMSLSACDSSPVEQELLPPVRLEITPDSVALHSKRETVDLTVVAYDAAGASVDPGLISWTTRDFQVAVAEPREFALRAVDDGKTVIVGRLETGASDSVVVTVEVRAASVQFDVPFILLTALGPGGWARYTARDALGYLLPLIEYDWITSDSTVVTVNEFGALTAVREGKAWVALEIDGVADTLPVTVTQVPATVVLTPAFGYTETPGAEFQLSAEVRDANGYPIDGRQLTWQSSDAAVATVNATGRVVTHAAGSAGISARDGNQWGSSGVTVGDPRDWDNVPEWSQLHGSATHASYVPVALDVGAFAESWTRVVAPAEGVLLRQVVTEGDRVVFATRGSGVHHVGVISGSTGAVQWVRDMASVGSVHQPSIHEGLVLVATSYGGDATLWGLDISTGDSVFAQPYQNSTDGTYMPVLAEGRVYLGGGHTHAELRAFDASTGAPSWQARSPTEVFTVPSVSGGVLYAYTGRGMPGLWGVEAHTGAELLHRVDPGFLEQTVLEDRSPVITEGGLMVFVQSERRLLAYDLATGSIAWEYEGHYDFEVAAGDGEVFVRRNGGLDVLRESDGALLWNWSDPDHPFPGSMIVTKNLVLLGNHALHRKSRTLVWSAPHPGGMSTLSGDGHLYVTYDGVLTRLRVR